MWSFGCVAAELVSRQPLIRPLAEKDPRERDKAVTGKDCIDAIRKEVGLPCWDVGLPGWPYLPDVFEPGTVETAASFLDSFPFFQKWFGQTGADWLAAETPKEERDPRPYAGFHASAGFAGCPAGLLALIKDCLKWKPERRLTLSDARLSGFLQPPGKVPQIALSMERG